MKGLNVLHYSRNIRSIWSSNWLGYYNACVFLEYGRRKGIIGAFYSSIPQQGKSTGADYLSAFWGFKRFAFARPLKNMLIEFLVSMGISRIQLQYIWNHLNLKRKTFLVSLIT